MLREEILSSWGRFAIHGVFGLATLLVMYIGATSPDIVLFVPVALLAAIGGWLLFQYPLINIAVLIAGFTLIADFDEGIQPSEIAYGLYYAMFLGHWFFTRIFLARRPIFATRTDRYLILFLLLAPLTIVLTVIYDGSIGGYIKELHALSMLSLYWPVKEAVRDNKRGIWVIVGALAFVGLLIFIRNFLSYADIINNASQAWQVARGRAVTNESLLLIPSFISMMLFIYSEKWSSRIIWALCFSLYFTGLILTQSRGYWASFIFGTGIVFLIVPLKFKLRMVTSALIAGMASFTIGLIVFGDVLLLIVSGLLDRFLSIQSAATKDLSLVNRFLENAAVWSRIQHNPILGHGLGTPFRFYDAVWQFSMNRSWIHNGYLSLWFRFGVWGLFLFLYVYASTAWTAFKSALSRRNDDEQIFLVVSLAALGALAAMSLSTNTSNAFFLADTLMIIGVLSGLVHGIKARPDGRCTS